MSRKVLLWLSAIAVLALVVAYQTVGSAARQHKEFAARADVPTVQPGTDVLAGIVVVPLRLHRYDYRRAAYGDAWDDANGTTAATPATTSSTAISSTRRT
jgi:hypothetical protein